jgi:uncharacterized membrane protein YkgB
MQRYLNIIWNERVKSIFNYSKADFNLIKEKVSLKTFINFMIILFIIIIIGSYKWIKYQCCGAEQFLSDSG